MLFSNSIHNRTLANNFSIFDNNNNANNNLLMNEFDNDYYQQQIYQEVRQNNSVIETWRHYFGVSGSIISLFGIIGM